jgi:hypothetical protein
VTFTKRQYIDYLIATTGNYTCTHLADHLDGEQAVSHDAISDYLAREHLTPRSLWETVHPLIADGPAAYLIVDDSVQDKRYARKIEQCQCRKARSQRNHLACCYLAWVSLQQHARQIGTTLYDVKRRLWENYLKAALRCPTIQAVGC